MNIKEIFGRAARTIHRCAVWLGDAILGRHKVPATQLTLDATTGEQVLVPIDDCRPRGRLLYLAFSTAELIFILWFIGFIVDKLVGSWMGTVNAYATGAVIGCLILAFTGLINRMFIIVEGNSGGVIENLLRTYQVPVDPNDRTELRPTRALRETGPGLQGILFWEKKFRIIDLGKKIDVLLKITTYSEDNIELVIEAQAILTPLQGYLCNLVRHDPNTVKTYFEGYFRAFIIQMLSHQLAQAIPGRQSITDKIADLKDDFKGCLGGPRVASYEERQKGTFSNTPQLISIIRSKRFQESVEAMQISKNTADAVKLLQDLGKLEPNQALIAVLAAQGVTNENLVDIKYSGFENAKRVYLGFGAMGGFGKGGKGKGGKQKQQQQQT